MQKKEKEPDHNEPPPDPTLRALKERGKLKADKKSKSIDRQPAQDTASAPTVLYSGAGRATDVVRKKQEESTAAGGSDIEARRQLLNAPKSSQNPDSISEGAKLKSQTSKPATQSTVPWYLQD